MYRFRMWLFFPLHRHLNILKGSIMEALDTLNAKVDALGVSAKAAEDKIAALTAQVATLQAAAGASADDLNAVSAKVDAIQAPLAAA